MCFFLTLLAQQLALETIRSEYANAQLECNAADERGKVLAAEVILLEDKVPFYLLDCFLCISYLILQIDLPSKEDTMVDAVWENELFWVCDAPVVHNNQIYRGKKFK